MSNRNLECDHDNARPAWVDARLCYAYLQLELIADTYPEGSAEQDCICHAMSKLDEADMLTRRAKESA